MKIVGKVLTGSRAYGLEVDDSDRDYIEVFVDEDPLFSNIPSKYWKNGTQYYELNEFVKILMDGDINVHQALWTNNNDISHYTSAWNILASGRKDFIAKKVIENWINTAEYEFGKATRVARIQLSDKTILDFLTYYHVNAITEKPCRKFTECVSSKCLEPGSHMSRDIKLDNFAVIANDLGKDMCSLYEGYGSSNSNDKIGMLDEDGQLKVVPFEIVPKLYYQFKGLLKYDRQAHNSYLRLKKNLSKVHIASGYSTKSMYQAFRILTATLAYLRYQKLPVKAGNTSQLMAIRKGITSVDELRTQFAEMYNHVSTTLADNKDIPSELNRNTVKDILSKCKAGFSVPVPAE